MTTHPSGFVWSPFCALAPLHPSPGIFGGSGKGVCSRVATFFKEMFALLDARGTHDDAPDGLHERACIIHRRAVDVLVRLRFHPAAAGSCGDYTRRTLGSGDAERADVPWGLSPRVWEYFLVVRTAVVVLAQEGAVEQECVRMFNSMGLLQWACTRADPCAVKALLASGLNPNVGLTWARPVRGVSWEHNALGMPPLHTLATLANDEGEACMDVLLSSPTIDLGTKDVTGFTALHLAAASKNPGCVRRLLAAGADPNLRTKDGDTALDSAVRTFNASEAALLRAQEVARALLPETVVGLSRTLSLVADGDTSAIARAVQGTVSVGLVRAVYFCGIEWGCGAGAGAGAMCGGLCRVFTWHRGRGGSGGGAISDKPGFKSLLLPPGSTKTGRVCFERRRDRGGMDSSKQPISIVLFLLRDLP